MIPSPSRQWGVRIVHLDSCRKSFTLEDAPLNEANQHATNSSGTTINPSGVFRKRAQQTSTVSPRFGVYIMHKARDAIARSV